MYIYMHTTILQYFQAAGAYSTITYLVVSADAL